MENFTIIERVREALRVQVDARLKSNWEIIVQDTLRRMEQVQAALKAAAADVLTVDDDEGEDDA